MPPSRPGCVHESRVAEAAGSRTFVIRFFFGNPTATKESFFFFFFFLFPSNLIVATEIVDEHDLFFLDKILSADWDKSYQ